MIPADFIAEWRREAPWTEDSQVEQDLVVSRALVEIFQDEEVAKVLTFRGGTALYKLHLSPAPRYSEDIDLVQSVAGPIGDILDRLRRRLDSWLDRPKRSFREGRVTLLYRFESEGAQALPLRLKIEINSREHFNVLGLETKSFEVRSRWFSGSAEIPTFTLDELLGTKLRALYQRKKGRDLFDLWWAARHAPVDFDRVVRCFHRYLEHDGMRVSRAEFEANVLRKLEDPAYASDIGTIVAPTVHWDRQDAARIVAERIFPRLEGEPWRGEEQAGDVDGGSRRRREGT